MTIDLILVARGSRDARDAKRISRTLVVSRAPRDRADAYALRVWRVLLPLLERHGGDASVLLDAAREAGVGHVVEAALTLPDWLLAMAEPTPRLIELFNVGAGTVWRLPAGRARGKSVEDVRADMALRFAGAA